MIVIIGAGIAGLTCANYLKRKGIDALILEKSDEVGGRIRTDEVDGFLLDRGFQVFLTSYPEAAKVLNYDKLDLIKLPSGARIRMGHEFVVMPNPLKNLLSAPKALVSPVGGIIDKFRILQLVLSTRNADEPRNQIAEDGQTTLSLLKSFGFSKPMIEQFFRPFFRGVFLERNLSTSAALFKYLYGLFAKGDVVLPKIGMRAIPEQLANNLAPEQIRLNTSVTRIEGNQVCLETGETIEAEKIVLATDASAAANLDVEKTGVDFNGTVCMYFERKMPVEFERDPYLIINSNQGELIDHVFQASDSVTGYAPAGKTLISANIVGIKEVSEESVRTELSEWFGKEEPWRHLRTYRIPEALPQYIGNPQEDRELKIGENLYRCGDYTAYPSINGAMKTGRLVAEMIVG